jgi:hypothetical protein
MPAATVHSPSPTEIPAGLGARAGLDARAGLRAQVARLERRLSRLACELGASGRSLSLPSPAGPCTARPAASRGPRLLDLGELERARDELVGRVRAAEARLGARAESERAAATRLEAMLADPGRHRFERVPRAELGLPGCGAYEVRPRLGLLGMLAGWWEVKLSSGCPLSRAGRRRPAGGPTGGCSAKLGRWEPLVRSG